MFSHAERLGRYRDESFPVGCWGQWCWDGGRASGFLGGGKSHSPGIWKGGEGAQGALQAVAPFTPVSLAGSFWAKTAREKSRNGQQWPGVGTAPASGQWLAGAGGGGVGVGSVTSARKPPRIWGGAWRHKVCPEALCGQDTSWAAQETFGFTLVS